MGQEATSRREEVRAQAADWVVRLSDPAGPPEDRAAFEAWRDADPAHDAAYEREAAAWDELDRLRAFRPPGATPDPDLFALAPRRTTRFGALRPNWAAAAAMAVTLGLAGAIGVTAVATPAYATGVGERRVVVLKDGTRIELNTNSKVVVRYRRGVREVTLLRGEALFDVASDARPFVVRTPDSRLTASGAEMAVRLTDDGGAAVTVREGRVAAEDAGGHTLAALTPAQEATVGAAGAQIAAVSAEEIDRTLAWRQGAIALNGQSLAEAVAEFNRYNKRQVVIADGAAAGHRVGGYFQTSDLSGFVRAVTQAFPVTATTEADGSIRLASS